MNLNSINKKIVIYLSLVGFILSFVSGVISGNNFSTLFIRSLISGVFIGIVIIIANIIIAIYLPELLDSLDDDSSEEEDSHVDIVMPEEKYEVQKGESSTPEDVVGGDAIASENPNTSFKEVDLDNLKSLSASDGSSGIETQNYSDDTGDSAEYTTTSSAGGSSDIGSFSPEEYAKAVRSKLKKD